jgi:23S rRNA pseudouridine1911/1915/1917 synthase
MDGRRIDVALAELIPCSRSHVQTLLELQCITCNGYIVTKAKQKVFNGDDLRIIPSCEDAPLPTPLPLDVVYEDDWVIVINKPAGLVVHPSVGHVADTLVNAVMARASQLSNVGDYPGIVHRLDKDTSGLIVVAKTNAAHAALSAQFTPGSQKRARRTYLGLVHGHPPLPSGTIQTYIARHKVNRKKMCVISEHSKALDRTNEQSKGLADTRLVDTSGSNKGGRLAITMYERVWGDKVSLMRFHLLTGRTHQIRVHCQYAGFPIVGDPVYGGARGNIKFHRQALHASELVFEHPSTHKSLYFEAPLPADMLALMDEAPKETS